MNARLIPYALLAVFAVGLAESSAQDPVFRADVAVVQVDVFVGQRGRALLGLGREDFQLLDDGEKQEILRVEMENVPVQVALVLDASDSVAGPTLHRLKEAAHAFVDNLGEDDSASLITFSHHLTRQVELTR